MEAEEENVLQGNNDVQAEAPGQAKGKAYEGVQCDEESQRIYIILKEILARPRAFHDEKDESIHPSFTNFKVPYQMTCRLRYSHKRDQYERQFQHELNEMLNHQPTAYDAARYNRHLCITTLWPPLHNRREIEYFQNHFFKLSPKQKKRLEILLNTEIN